MYHRVFRCFFGIFREEKNPGLKTVVSEKYILKKGRNFRHIPIAFPYGEKYGVFTYVHEWLIFFNGFSYGYRYTYHRPMDPSVMG